MRSGFSTSACAAAAAAAGIESLLTGKLLTSVTINLPAKRDACFVLARCERQGEGVLCGVVKDAGDDPDVTNGLEIQALVEHRSEPGLELLGGHGVGIVTLPGLPVDIGQPAINPGPRRLIRKVVQETLKNLGMPADLGLRITVIVPEGERIAAQTMNPKLGILGGISILGTNGIVRPYSAPAFRASIYLEMKVAHETGYDTIGLATGKRSTAYLRAYLNDERGHGVVDVGDEIDYPLQLMSRFSFRQVICGGMIGKFSKLAQGRFQTHVQEGEVNFEFLSEIAASQGAPIELTKRILTARTAHQVQTWLKDIGIRIEPELARLAAQKVAEKVDGKLEVKALIFSLDGELLGEAVCK